MYITKGTIIFPNFDESSENILCPPPPALVSENQLRFLNQSWKCHDFERFRLPQILPALGGRKEFVYDCGVIGLCPLCTRETPLTGVGSLLVGG